MSRTGNSDRVCVYELPPWSSRIPSRIRGGTARCPQSWPARPTGCPRVGTEEYRIVWWRSLQGMLTSRRSLSKSVSHAIIVGHRLWGERRSNVHILSLPQRLFFHSCPSSCKPYGYQGGVRSHSSKFHRYSNQERHPLSIISMRTVTFPLGCSSRTMYHPVPPHRQTTRSPASSLPASLRFLLP